MKYKTLTIPIWQLELALLSGWEVWAYSEYMLSGEPKFAEIRKEIQAES